VEPYNICIFFQVTVNLLVPKKTEVDVGPLFSGGVSAHSCVFINKRPVYNKQISSVRLFLRLTHLMKNEKNFYGSREYLRFVLKWVPTLKYRVTYRIEVGLSS